MIGTFTKQLAQQAIGNTMKDVVDSLRPPDLAKIIEGAAADKPAAPAQAADNLGITVLAQIQAMQKALKEDEELVILCTSALEPLRIFEIYLPTWKLAVLTGIDTEKNVTRVIAPVDTLHLVCKVMKSPKPVRLRLIAPRP